MIRFDGPLFFASADYLEEEIIRHLETKPELKHIIIEASAISMMDASGEIALRHIIRLARGAGIEISFSDLHQDVLDVMVRTGLIKEIGVENVFPQMEEALNNAFHRTHQDSWEKLCPLKTVVYKRSIHE
jgi:SulP family sulfate permease